MAHMVDGEVSVDPEVLVDHALAVISVVNEVPSDSSTGLPVDISTDLPQLGLCHVSTLMECSRRSMPWHVADFRQTT